VQTIRLNFAAMSLLLSTTLQAQEATAPPASNDSKVKTAKAEANAGAAAPTVTLIDGPKVKPEEAMIFTRSVLVEQGSAVAAMSENQENIDTVRYNMNTYRIGYALPAEKVGERFIFSGPVKGWRATSTGDTSTWPPFTYMASRKETMRRAKLLQPIILAEPIDEMNNLRAYYLPSLEGHDGKQYQIAATAVAFFIHPQTGQRMTVLIRGGRTYGSVNKPLAATSEIYVKELDSYSAGPLGLGRARVPSVFYVKSVKSDVEPFAEGDIFDKLMATVLAAHNAGPLPVDDFKTLFHEMTRYTGGAVE
jgi:hypothetical protein